MAQLLTTHRGRTYALMFWVFVAALIAVLPLRRIEAESYVLLLSASPDRSAPLSLQGQTVSGNIYVFTSPGTGVSRVRFWIDKPSMTGTPYKTEANAPHDL